MTKTELIDKLARRYWDRLKHSFPDAETDEIPEAVRWRIRALVDDLYELGVIVDTVPNQQNWVKVAEKRTGTSAAGSRGGSYGNRQAN